MALLSRKQVKALTLYGDAHRARLEAAGKFPRRVRLGQGRYARVGWVESEIMEWIQAKIAIRDRAYKKSP
ncbi:MAG: AlpA family phage regulatory protein [Fimbriimonadaceae bacterium]